MDVGYSLFFLLGLLVGTLPTAFISLKLYNAHTRALQEALNETLATAASFVLADTTATSRERQIWKNRLAGPIAVAGWNPFQAFEPKENVPDAE